MPRNNAAKVNVLQQVVKAIIDAGFRGDLSYSALMYPNEGDTRSILMWLNQNVKTASVDDKQTTAKDVLQTSIALRLKQQLSLTWAPLFFPGSPGAPYAASRPIETVPIRSAFIEGVVSSRHAKQIDYITKLRGICFSCLFACFVDNRPPFFVVVKIYAVCVQSASSSLASLRFVASSSRGWTCSSARAVFAAQ